MVYWGLILQNQTFIVKWEVKRPNKKRKMQMKTKGVKWLDKKRMHMKKKLKWEKKLKKLFWYIFK